MTTPVIIKINDLKWFPKEKALFIDDDAIVDALSNIGWWKGITVLGQTKDVHFTYTSRHAYSSLVKRSCWVFKPDTKADRHMSLLIANPNMKENDDAHTRNAKP